VKGKSGLNEQGQQRKESGGSCPRRGLPNGSSSSKSSHKPCKSSLRVANLPRGVPRTRVLLRRSLIVPMSIGSMKVGHVEQHMLRQTQSISSFACAVAAIIVRKTCSSEESRSLQLPSHKNDFRCAFVYGSHERGLVALLIFRVLVEQISSMQKLSGASGAPSLPESTLSQWTSKLRGFVYRLSQTPLYE